MTETIAAIATPPGEGAIALLRISGPEAFLIAEALFVGKKNVPQMQARHLYFGTIVYAGEILDEVLLSIFKTPHSYTGEDSVEISCHGGSLIANRILKALLASGARMARPGEFTQRAYLHGKMDLTQAEAVMDLITAQTERSQKLAAEQLSGRLGQAIEILRAKLLAAVAHLEAFFDFPEDDISPETGAALEARIQEARHDLIKLLATAHEGRLLREGISIALCGAPNAGKSSLLNYLLGIKRAIVSPIAGTTRDTIEEQATLEGFPFRLIDTAGIRITEDLIEQEGVVRAQASAAAADICLHVVDATTLEGAVVPLSPKELLVFNKSDLFTHAEALQKSYPEALFISCITGEGIAALSKRMVAHVTGKTASAIQETSSLLAINSRHQACLKRALEATEKALALIAAQEPLELLAIELHTALESVGAVVGATNTEEILGEIFGSFCIGK